LSDERRRPIISRKESEALLHRILRRRTHKGDRAVEAGGESLRAAGRPSIALALGGGAARGFAHVGVMRTLLAHGVVPDVITGTSMGAVMGGCYAAGQLETFEDWARSLTRRRVFGYLDISLSGSGLINGTRLTRLLESTLGKTKIEDLDTRFAAIATEINTGHEIWLTRGRLVEALRASYALPGVFAPVRVGGRWLVDGALVNPVPVSAARALDARIVIGVSLNADLIGRGTTVPGHGFDETEEPADEEVHKERGRRRTSVERFLKRKFIGRADRPGLSTVMIDAYHVMQDRITRARLAGDPADIMISPRLGHVGMFDFHRAEESIKLGAEAAERSIATIAEAIEALA
jgi:NTE family protein